MKKFLARLGYAGNGLRIFFSADDNGRIQLGVVVLVLMAGAWFHITKAEMLAVLLCIALVISLEMINAAIEKLADFVEPARHESIGRIKDIAAGAVLWAAILSAVVGLIVFVPYVLEKLAWQ